MISLVAAAAAGLAAGAVARAVGTGVVDVPALARENHRGSVIPTAGGILPIVAVLALAAADPGTRVGELPVLVAIAGFGFLGLVDDVAGDANARGFRGHLSALARGRLTTGALKLLGGAAVAFAIAQMSPDAPWWQQAGDAALIALAANLGNLFDRAPGRVIKVGAAGFIALVAATAGPGVLVPAAAVVGAFSSVLVPDLRERLMLGDTGANALGAALGVAVVLSCTPATRGVVLAALLALNAAAEVVSFSRVIDAVPPLRAADRLGRLP